MLPVRPSSRLIRPAEIKCDETGERDHHHDGEQQSGEQQIAGGAPRQQHGRGDGAGAGQERDRQREGGDVAHVLFDRLLGGLAFAAHAHAEHHLKRD
jgi:hypothetical protein